MTFVRFQNLLSEIANFAEAEPGESWDVVCHRSKNIFDRVKAVACAESLQQVAQNFPVVSGLAGRTDRAIQSLQSAIAVDHGSAFLGKAARGENCCRELSRLVRKNIHEN